LAWDLEQELAREMVLAPASPNAIPWWLLLLALLA